MNNLLIFFAQNLNVPIPGTGASTPQIRTIINIVLSIAGAVALLVITMAGFRYVTSRGNPSQVQQARDAIIYSLIGLVVMMSAFLIVNFVVFKLR
ncbi:MAG TPA: pilin [Candidatus Saccharimonadales bacterium]